MQAFVGAGVEPGEAAAEQLHGKAAVFEIHLVDGGDFEFAACGGFDLFGEVDHAVVVEIKAGYRPVGFGFARFFFDGAGFEVLVEFDDAEAFGIAHLVGEDGGAVAFGGGLAQGLGEGLAVEDVVAEHQADAVAADKFFADDKGLGKAVGAGLLGVCDMDAEAATVAEQAAEGGVVFGGGDDEDVADAGEHEHRQGVVDHGFVVHGQQLFGNAAGDGVKTGAGAAGKDDAFHGISPVGWVFRQPMEAV